MTAVDPLAATQPMPRVLRPGIIVTIYGDLGAVDITRHGYALDEGHADLTRDLLEQAVTSVRAGVLSTDVGIEVARWVRTTSPDDIVGTVIL